MPEDISPPSQPTGRFESVLAEILQAEEQGRIIDVPRYCESFPELAERLRAYFRNREHFARMAPVLAPTASRPAAPPAPPDLVRGSQFEGYEILRELGRGGMGIIYLARQRSAKRLVALKLIRKDRLEHLDPEQRLQWLIRFRTEGQAAARIANDRVVTVYEVGAHDGRPFYSMRYVEGPSLAENLKAGPLPNRSAAILMEQVARAVQAIHEKGVLHRDLKPHNILVDARGRPYVTDFGLAKCSDAADSLTHTGEMLGSAHYMSPEQAQDSANVSEATDVYGLGATLYALLTGRPPFQGATVAEVLHQVKYREPDPPRRLNSAVASDLNTITLRCLEKEPGRRFPSAAAVADELQRYLEGRPILSRPVGPPGRLWRWCRRKPAFASLCAAAVVLVTLSGTLYWAYSSASRTVGEIVPKLIQTGEVLGQEQERTKARAYLKDMRGVQQFLNGGEHAKARELLVQWRESDYRDWEWHFLDAQLRDASFSMRGHTSAVLAVAWSPDGTRLASADGQGIIKVWDVAANKKLHELSVKAGGVSALAWSADGTRLAAAGQGPTIVQIWDVDSGKALPTLRQAANINPPSSFPLPAGASREDQDFYSARMMFLGSWTASLIWNSSSEKLALADEDGKIQVWDLSTSKKDPLVLRAHRGGVYSAAWSPDGKRLASVGGDGLVKIWDAAADKPIFTLPIRTANNKNPTISYALTWTEDGKRLNVVSSVGEIRDVDVGSRTVAAPRQLIQRDSPQVPPGILPGPAILTGPSKRFVWGPGGKLLASIENPSGQMKIWDAATVKEGFPIRPSQAVRPMMGLPAAQCAPAWDRSGRRIALGENDGMVQTWRVGSSRRAVRSPVRNALAWSADNRHVLGIRAWSLADDETVQAQLESRKDAMEALQKAARAGGITPPDPRAIMQPSGPNPRGAASQKPKPPIQICDAITGEVVRTLGGNTTPNASPLDALAESSDGKWLALATRAGLLQLWPMAEGAPAFTLENPPQGAAPAGGSLNSSVVLVWSPDGKRFAHSTYLQTTIRVWDPSTRETVRTLEGHGQPLRSLAWSADGKRLASVGDDGSVKVWDVSSGKKVFDFPYYVKPEANRTQVRPNASATLSWCRDGKRLAVAGEDEEIKVWDVDARKEVVTLQGRPSEKDIHDLTCAVAWSPNGKRLASTSPDGTFLLWDTATWQEVLILRLASAGPFRQGDDRPGLGGTLAWSPDGQQLAFFGGGGSVTIWDATPEESKLGQ